MTATEIRGESQMLERIDDALLLATVEERQRAHDSRGRTSAPAKLIFESDRGTCVCAFAHEKGACISVSWFHFPIPTQARPAVGEQIKNAKYVGQNTQEHRTCAQVGYQVNCAHTYSVTPSQQPLSFSLP